MGKTASTPRSRHALIVLNNIAQTLVVIESLPQTLRNIAQNAKEVLEADIVDLYEYQEARREFVLPPVLIGERRNRFVPKTKIYEDDVVMQAVKLGAPQYLKDAQHAPGLTGPFEVPRPDRPEQRFVIREGVVSSVTLPLKAAQETVGVMFVNYRTAQKFGDEQKLLIESFGNLAAIAIHNARLFQSARDGLQSEQKQRLFSETLQEVAHAVNSARTLEEVADEVFKQLRRVIDYHSAALQRVEGDRRQLIRGDGWQPPVERRAAALYRNISEDALIKEIAATRRPLVLSHVKSDPRWEPLLETEWIQSWIGAPLVFRGQLVGLLTLDHQLAGYYTPEAGATVAAFAGQVAMALYNASQTQALAALNRLALQLMSLDKTQQDPRRLLGQIAESALSALNADLIELYEYNQARDLYILPQVTAGVREGPLVPKEQIYPDDVVARLIQRGEPLYLAQPQDDPIFSGRYTFERPGRPQDRFIVRERLMGVAAIPLRSGNETVGLMFANYRTPQPFTLEQKERIQLFANQAAITIHNTRMYYDVNRRFETLVEFGQILTSSIDLKEDEILKLIREQAGGLMDVGNMYIALYEADLDHPDKYDPARPEAGEIHGTVRFGLMYEDGQARAVETRKAGRGKTEEIIRTRQPLLHATKAEAEAWYALPGHKEYTGNPSPSWLGVPILLGDKVLGVIATYHPTRNYVYSLDDLSILQGIAEQAAVALENARLYYRVNRRLATLIKLGKALSSGIQLKEDEIVKLIHEQARELMDTDNMYVALYDEAQDALQFGLALKNGQPIHIASRKIDDTHRGRTEEIVRTRSPIFIATRQESIAWYSQPGREEKIGDPLASWIGVPIVLGDKVLGVIATYHPTRDYVYSLDDLSILQGMAEQAAVALENARLYEHVQEAAKLEYWAEIGHLAGNLAHRIGNKGGTIRLRADELATYLHEKLPGDHKAEDKLEAIQRNNQYLLNLSDLLFKPQRASEERVAPANIKLMLDSALSNAEISSAVTVKMHVAEPLPLAKANRFFVEVFLEIIANAVEAMRKTPVKELTITADADTHWVRVRFTDTGVGIADADRKKIFDLFMSSRERDSQGQHYGFGLWWVRTFLRKIGGDIDVESQPGAGATFTVRVPRGEQAK